jgi:adenylyltransferase/sulfurtransferase
MSYLERIVKASAEVKLESDELNYYSRHLLLPGVGTRGQLKLKAARVLVVGAGGLGCPVLSGLVGAGVGTLCIVDDDCVTASNLARQWLHGHEAIGAAKVKSAQAALSARNPFVEIKAIRERFTLGNGAQLCAGYDLVVDATDSLHSREIIDQVCAEIGCPWVHGALYRNSGQVAVLWPKKGARYAQLFAQSGSESNCSEAGVLGAVASIIGNLQALEVIKLITGLGQPLFGQLLTFDLLAQQLHTFSFAQLDRIEPIFDTDQPVTNAYGISVESLQQMRSIQTPVRLLELRSEDSHPVDFGQTVESIEIDQILTEGLAESGTAKAILICPSGSMSALLAEALNRRNEVSVYYLEGGSAAWSEATMQSKKSPTTQTKD